MPEAPHDLRDVFGISRDVPLSYVPRESVDGKLKANLRRSRHLVIHGSSKQGKTCLRKECLKEDEYIVVQCSNKWTLADLHSSILKEAGFEITQSSSRSSTGKVKINAKIVEYEVGGKTESTTQPLELEPDDVNDIIKALKQIGFAKFVILEDFHYLPLDTQKDFSVALKAFHEKSNLSFIIIGVWLEENRLVVYNGDLTGRLVSIDADKWTSDDLRKVVEAGEHLLYIQFDPTFIDDLILSCSGSVYLLQEACYKVCSTAGVERTGDTQVVVGRGVDAAALTQSIVNEQQARYHSFLIQVANGFHETDLKMYQWLLYPVIMASPDELQKGLKRPAIRNAICEKHPKGRELNQGNITIALQSLANLQVAKDVKPIVLDYDQTNQLLTVVDRWFLIWKKFQNPAELLDLIDLSLT